MSAVLEVTCGYKWRDAGNQICVLSLPATPQSPVPLHWVHKSANGSRWNVFGENWPSPATWVVGEVETAVEMNRHVRSSLEATE